MTGPLENRSDGNGDGGSRRERGLISLKSCRQTWVRVT